jgi:hypothetical protein
MASTTSRSTDEGGQSQAAEKAQEVAGQVQEKVGGAAQQAKGQVRSQVDERSTQAGKRVNSTASDMRSVAEQLRQQGKDQPAKLAEQAASRAQRMGDYLTQADGDRILRDVENEARRRPWAVVAGGVALGFLASRFLKASSSERYRSAYERTGVSNELGRSTGAGNGHSVNPVGSTGVRPTSAGV